MKDYVCKSKISEFRKSCPLIYQKIPLKVYQENFNKCYKTQVLITGSRFDTSRMRHTKYVDKKELLDRTFRDYFGYRR